jgi:uncharacterized protein
MMMSENGHDRHALFGDDREVLHPLKLESEKYHQLAECHHRLSRQIGRIETGLDAASDEWLENLRKQRLDLLDEIADMITKWKDTQ